MRALPFICVCLCAVSCTDSDSSPQFFDPDTPRLAQKLGIREGDWREIQKLIAKEHDYSLAHVERSPRKQVGAWLATKTPNGLEKHGPVFFYVKHEGRWYRSEDMSEWRDDK